VPDEELPLREYYAVRGRDRGSGKPSRRKLVYVLSSPNLYHLPPERIRSLLLPIINLKGLKLSPRWLYRRALDIYATHHIDFEDALAIAHMERQGISEIVSYDTHFDRIEGVERREP